MALSRRRFFQTGALAGAALGGGATTGSAATGGLELGSNLYESIGVTPLIGVSYVLCHRR